MIDLAAIVLIARSECVCKSHKPSCTPPQNADEPPSHIDFADVLSCGIADDRLYRPHLRILSYFAETARQLKDGDAIAVNHRAMARDLDNMTLKHLQNRLSELRGFGYVKTHKYKVDGMVKQYHTICNGK